MKNIFKYLIFGLIAGMLTPSCEKDDSDAGPLTVETTRIKEVAYTSAVCGAKVMGKYTESGLCYAETENPTTASKVVKINQPQFESEIEGLEKGKTYYVRAYAIGVEGPVYGQQKSFTTYAQGEPIVRIAGVSKIGNTSATAECNIMSSGGIGILKRGFCYAKTELPTISDVKIESEGSVGRIISTLTQLEDGETYYVRAFATTADKIYYSEPIKFKTVLFNKPIPSVTGLVDVIQTSMNAQCAVTRDNDLEISERGIYYGTKKDQTKATKIKDSATGPGTYKIALPNLTAGTLYYVWAYAVNIKGEAVSEPEAMSTTDERPTAVTNAVGNIVGFSAITSMSITSLGLHGAPVTEAGVCWSTSENPTIADSKQVVKAPMVGTFRDIDIRRLKPATTYHIRAYATNTHGTSYGADESFTTREDMYRGYIRTFNAGSEAPYTNAIKYATDYVKTDSISPYMATLYTNLQSAITKYGATRKLLQLVYEFIPISDGTMGCQIQFTYTSADGKTNYVAKTQYRVSQDNNDVFTFSDMAPFTGNAATMYNSKSLTALERGYLDDVYGFLTKDKIVIDWTYSDATTDADKRVDGQFRLSHLNNPEENMVFGIYRFSYPEEKPIPVW